MGPVGNDDPNMTRLMKELNDELDKKRNQKLAEKEQAKDQKQQAKDPRSKK